MESNIGCDLGPQSSMRAHSHGPPGLNRLFPRENPAGPKPKLWCAPAGGLRRTTLAPTSTQFRAKANMCRAPTLVCALANIVYWLSAKNAESVLASIAKRRAIIGFGGEISPRLFKKPFSGYGIDGFLRTTVLSESHVYSM